MQKFLPVAFFQKEFKPFKDCTISIATHALHYGTGAYGGLRGTVNPRNTQEVLLFRLDKHSHRLENSAKYLGYNLDSNYIAKTITEFCLKNQPQTDFYIRPLVYTSDLGISPRIHDIEKDFLIYGIEFGDYFSPEGIKLCFSSWMRNPDQSIPARGKITGGYINSALAKSEAFNRGFDDAILFNSRGYVSEGSAMNIFMVRNNQIITPSLDQDCLEGITRESVLTLAKDLGFEILERSISKTELLVAEEVFLTGTAARITPVYQIENYSLPKKRPITQKLTQELKNITLDLNPNYKNWITKIKLFNSKDNSEVY